MAGRCAQTVGQFAGGVRTGEMPTILRKQKLARLRNVGSGDIGLLSNARCLSEGVDVPALDGVAFIDPRSSEIDIIQSVGRAIRLSENKNMGTIVLPVFIEQTDNAENALAASGFKPIWDVLEALKSHDDRLSDELDQLRIELGAKRMRSVGTSDLTKIVFDLPTSVNATFASSLRARLVEKTTESWLFWFGLLETFVEDRGHSRVLRAYKTDDGDALGSWVAHQRTFKDRLEPDRRQRLEILPGWSWDPRTDLWEEGLAHLKTFSDQHGHCRVPFAYKTANFRLGSWVTAQRMRASPETNFSNIISGLNPDRKLRLEALPGWSWAAVDHKWEGAFAELAKFSQQEGHSRVSRNYKTADVTLDRWVERQKIQFSRGKLEPDRRRRLEALPGWVWSRPDGWEEGFAYLRQFSDREGHCRVPEGYKTDHDYPLGAWVSHQTKHTRNPDRRRRLEALSDWSWSSQLDSFEAVWEEGFANLERFSKREGHSRVSSPYKTDDGYKLGEWVRNLRRKKAGGTFIRLDRQQRLEALPDWSWTPESDRLKASWEKAFANLKQFLEREGHSRMPSRYKTDDGFSLARWVDRQRSRRDTMDPDLRKRLEALPGWVWKIEK